MRRRFNPKKASSNLEVNLYNKYGNVKTEVDGIVFDSKKEARYYETLLLRKKAKDIIGFELQPVFELQPKFKYGGKTIRAIRYVADFLVYHEGQTEIVDVKGMQTATFKLKWKMLKFKYGQTGEYIFTIV